MQLLYGAGLAEQSAGDVGDVYINTNTQVMYKKTDSATWTALSGAAVSESNPTLSSNTNVASNVLKTYRDGKFMVGEGVITWDGAGDDGGTFAVTIPGAEVIDTAKLAGGTSATNTGASRVGSCSFFNNGTAFFSGDVQYLSTTTISFTVGSALVGTTFENGDGLKYSFRVPIVGW